MNKGTKRGTSAQNPHKQTLKRWFERTVAVLSRDATKDKPTTNANSGNWGDLLNALYSTPTTAAEEYRTALPHSITPALAEKMAHHQITIVDQALKTGSDLERGLADDRVIILILAPFLFNYTSVLLEHISRMSLGDDSSDGLMEAKKAAGRIWMLGATGLTPTGVPEAEIETVYTTVHDYFLLKPP